MEKWFDAFPVIAGSGPAIGSFNNSFFNALPIIRESDAVPKTKTYTIDAVLKITGLSKTYTMDAYLETKLVLSKTYTLDSAIRKAITKTYGANLCICRQGFSPYTIDIMLGDNWYLSDPYTDRMWGGVSGGSPSWSDVDSETERLWGSVGSGSGTWTPAENPTERTWG